MYITYTKLSIKLLFKRLYSEYCCLPVSFRTMLIYSESSTVWLNAQVGYCVIGVVSAGSDSELQIGVVGL